MLCERFSKFSCRRPPDNLGLPKKTSSSSTSLQLLLLPQCRCHSISFTPHFNFWRAVADPRGPGPPPPTHTQWHTHTHTDTHIHTVTHTQLSKEIHSLKPQPTTLSLQADAAAENVANTAFQSIISIYLDAKMSKRVQRKRSHRRWSIWS